MSADAAPADGVPNDQGIADGKASNGVNGTTPHGRRPGAEAVSLRAYEIFLARGGQAGNPLADWLQAEAELSAGSTAKS